MDAEGQSDVDAVFRQAPAGIGGRAEHKTAPVPPAVRAPVFPHALPVMEGLKPAILTRGGAGRPPPPKNSFKKHYLPSNFVMKVSAICKNSRKEHFYSSWP